MSSWIQRILNKARAFVKPLITYSWPNVFCIVVTDIMGQTLQVETTA